MRTGYFNGERVYVYDNPNFINNKYDGSYTDKVQIFKHKDLIRLLNNLGSSG